MSENLISKRQINVSSVDVSDLAINTLSDYNSKWTHCWRDMEKEDEEENRKEVGGGVGGGGEKGVER